MKDIQNGDRAQAFTLEGFVASVVILTAILLALQSVVLTPTTGGAVDQEVQQQLRTEAHDVLVASAGNASSSGVDHDLSHVVRFWSGSEKSNDDTWVGAIDENIGYGSREPMWRNETLFGEALNGTFTQRGYVYNVILEYRNASAVTESEQVRMVYRGVPSDNAITTTFTVTLYDNDTLTGVNKTSKRVDCTEKHLEEIKPKFGEVDWNMSMSPNCYYPIPEAAVFDDDPQTPNPRNSDKEKGEKADSPIYNVIEIRVIVW